MVQRLPKQSHVQLMLEYFHLWSQIQDVASTVH